MQAAQAAQETHETQETFECAHPELTFNQYSAKSIALFGVWNETTNQEIRQLGGKYNKFLKGGTGWIISKAREGAVQKYILTGEVDKELADGLAKKAFESSKGQVAETNGTKKEIKIQTIQMLSVEGDTYSKRQQLYRLNSVWYPHNKVWLVPVDKKEELTKLLGQ